jgi:RHS repeat-associated protein
MGNNSQFTLDSDGRNVKIVEQNSGSTTNTKQFVWCGKIRCQAWDASGNVTAQYFTLGEDRSGINYFFTADHLANSPNYASQFASSSVVARGAVFSPLFTSSIREMTDSSGAVQGQLSYDPYGRPTQLQGSMTPAFQFGDYYFHAPSRLSLTVTRAYSSGQGRFVNRDTIGESGGLNLYSYMANHPVLGVDPNGTCAAAIPIIVFGLPELVGLGATVIGIGIAHDAGTLAGNALGNAMSNGMGGTDSGAGAGAGVGIINCNPNNDPCNPPRILTLDACLNMCNTRCSRRGSARWQRCVNICAGRKY